MARILTAICLILWFGIVLCANDAMAALRPTLFGFYPGNIPFWGWRCYVWGIAAMLVLLTLGFLGLRNKMWAFIALVLLLLVSTFIGGGKCV